MRKLSCKRLSVVIAARTGIDYRTVHRVVRSAFTVIAETLAAPGTDVTINGFGRFTAATRRPRTGRNPRTGEAVAIPARRYPAFHPSPLLVSRVARKETHQ